jgi:hypothetical protein
MSLYDTDYLAWTRAQAEAVRSRSGNEIDWDNLAEEIDDLGKAVTGELKSRYIVLLSHLLKWIFQPERRSASWETTIEQQRLAIADHINDNPSLKSADHDIFLRAYRQARLKAARETKLDKRKFPDEAPFSPQQARDDDWWPSDGEAGPR